MPRKRSTAVTAVAAVTGGVRRSSDGRSSNARLGHSPRLHRHTHYCQRHYYRVHPRVVLREDDRRDDSRHDSYDRPDAVDRELATSFTTLNALRSLAVVVAVAAALLPDDRHSPSVATTATLMMTFIIYIYIILLTVFKLLYLLSGLLCERVNDCLFGSGGCMMNIYITTYAL